MSEACEALSAHFKKLKKESNPFPTNEVRKLTGLVEKNDDPDSVALPPHHSKHCVHEHFCFERGWITTKKSKTQGIDDDPEKHKKDHMMMTVKCLHGQGAAFLCQLCSRKVSLCIGDSAILKQR